MALSAVDCVTDNRCFYNLKIKNKYYEANKADTIQDVLPSRGALIHKMLNGKKQLRTASARPKASLAMLIMQLKISSGILTLVLKCSNMCMAQYLRF